MKARWLLLACCAASSVALADDGDPITAAATAEERVVLGHLDKEELIKARDAAEAVLAKDPRSLIATWAMARIQHDEEGNHARALFYIHKAEGLLDARFPDAVAWDKRLRLEEFWIDSEMDRMADALEVLDRADAKFGKSEESRRIWPLVKLGRWAEARALGTQLTTSSDEWDRAQAFNGMLSLEFEAHDRDATYKWALGAIDATRGKDCTILRNAAGCAYVRFKLREAEELGLRAHEAGDTSCDGQGYDQLAGLYLNEGEFQKALAALKSFKATPIPKRYRPHYALARRALLADILFALGKTEDAERLAGEVYGQPERAGMISGPRRALDYVRALRYWQALDARLVREAEKASYRPWLAGFTVDNVRLAVTRWILRRVLVDLTADDDLLVTVTRPNLGELAFDGAWRRMALIDVLGRGVVRTAAVAGRALDLAYPEASAYYDAFDAELAYRGGDLDGAVTAGERALTALPKEELLLRWRTEAWLADADRRLGAVDAALPHYHEVLQKFPSILRILDLPLPASASGDGTALGDAAAARVLDSTRFSRVANAPFRISATSKDGAIELCLRDVRGFQFACASGPKKATDAEAVIAAIDAFHDAAFSPKVALEQSDLNSLDGSPVRASADQMLKGILEP